MPATELPVVATFVRRIAGMGTICSLPSSTEPPMLKFSKTEPSALTKGLKLTKPAKNLLSVGATKPLRDPLKMPAAYSNLLSKSRP